MNIDQLMNALEKYKCGETSRHYTMQSFNYENEYIFCARLDSSNKWLDHNRTEMTKTWSIIYFPKKEFQNLPNFMQLKSRTSIKINKFNPRNEENKHLKGCHALRFYGMKQEPDEDIIRKILDFIFS